MPKPQTSTADVVPRKWQLTELWKILSRRTKNSSANNTRQVLEQCMDDIEAVLAKGGAIPDFTLHDEDHSFRVAQRMAQVIPADVLKALSSYEIGLLLLSAYLHDIGMSPRRGKVDAYYAFVLTGRSSRLDEDNKTQFRTWLDQEGMGVDPPIARGAPTEEDRQLASELVSYFARHKHNDWSKEYIEENLSTKTWKGYEHWIDDLIDVCQSHHWGYEQLAAPSFDPKLIQPGEVVHLRYLACVLRIGDILENDPERTPDVIFRHRDIKPSSKIYWWKDHEFVLEIERTNSVTIRARPRKAVIQRAIYQTGAAIELELRLCDRLNAEKPFNYMPKSDPLPHRWDLHQAVFIDVQPYKNSYVYVEGAFRPDTERLLQLLGGLELYRDRMASVRELLQNAFDAVRECVARERLALPQTEDASDPKWLKEIGNRYEVSIAIEKDALDDTLWLTCKDNGIGMTKAIIENYLLVSGNSRRADVLALDRKCQLRKFSSERTGKFGIGVLSYFMIADEIQITTRRSQLAGDADGEAWTFTSKGVGDFGELRRAQPGNAGTEVRLHLKAPPSTFGSDLLDYISAELIWSPCRLSVRDTTNSTRNLKLASGWVGPPRVPEPTTEIPSSLMNESATMLRTKVNEGTLPSGLGRYRAVLNYFELKGGTSIAFFRERDDTGGIRLLPIDKIDCYWLKSEVTVSYKGIKSSGLPAEAFPGCSIQFDWTSEAAGRISIDRSSFAASPDAEAAAKRLIEEFRSDFRHMLEIVPSNYQFLNSMLGDFKEYPNLSWISSADDGAGSWGPIAYPAVLLPNNAYIATLANAGIQQIAAAITAYGEEKLERAIKRSISLNWKGLNLTVLRKLQTSSYQDKFWDMNKFPPDRILIAQTLGRLVPVPLWMGPTIPGSASECLCEFPPSWKNVLASKLGDFFVNTRHPLAQLSPVIPSLNGYSQLARSLWSMLHGDTGEVKDWNELVTLNRTDAQRIVRDIWERAGFSEIPSDEVQVLVEKHDRVGMIVLSGIDARFEENAAAILPKVDAEWTLEFPQRELTALKFDD